MLFRAPSCLPADAVQPGAVFDLRDPSVEQGVTVFRRVLYAKVPIDARARALTLAASSALSLAFDSASFVIGRSNAAWVTECREDGTSVDITLRYPGALTRVDSGSYGHVALHRRDGDAISDDPTESGATGATLPGEFIASSFRAKFSEPIAKDLRLARSTTARTVEGAGPSLRSDASFDSLTLRGQPTTPRVSLRRAGSAERLFQWLEPGAFATRAYAAAGQGLQAALQPGLQRAFEQLRKEAPAGSATLLLELWIESDAPCRLTVAQAALDFLLEAELAPSPSQLVFDGSARVAAPFTLPAVPAGTRSVMLEGSVLVRGELLSEEAASALPPHTGTGLGLEAGDEAALPWTIDRPHALGGFALGWYGIAQGSRLELSLVMDGAGLPGQSVLARAELEPKLGPSMGRVRFARCVVQPGRYWLRVALRRGGGLWLAAPAAAPASIFRKSALDNGLVALPLALLHQPLEPLLGPAAGDAAAGVLPAAPFELSLDGTPAPLGANAADGALSIVLDAFSPPLAPTDFRLTATSSQALELRWKTARATYRA